VAGNTSTQGLAHPGKQTVFLPPMAAVSVFSHIATHELPTPQDGCRGLVVYGVCGSWTPLFVWPKRERCPLPVPGGWQSAISYKCCSGLTYGMAARFHCLVAIAAAGIN